MDIKDKLECPYSYYNPDDVNQEVLYCGMQDCTECNGQCEEEEEQ